MLTILSTIFSLPFMSGAIVGFVLQRLYCYQKARRADREHPLPNGGKHPVDHISRVWLAGLILVLSMGYMMLSTGRSEARSIHNQQETLRLTQQVKECWAEAYQQAKAQIKINQENDQISQQQQDLQRDYDRANSKWIDQLLAPPGDLANQDTQSPARKEWGIRVTLEYHATINALGARYDDLAAQRRQKDAERSQHKLPEALCGK